MLRARQFLFSTAISLAILGASVAAGEVGPAAVAPRTTIAGRPSARAVDAPPTTTLGAEGPNPIGDSEHDHNRADNRPVPEPDGLPLGSPFVGKYGGKEIEGYAPYNPQSVCDPAAGAGALGLRDLLLSRYPSTKSLGVSRDCTVGGQSEHKEGRAFDWGADINNRADAAAVNDFLTALLATDKHGNKYALARRMGIMYVIWDRKIWGVYLADESWRPYGGPNAHTDHVHISFTLPGGRGETSYWSGAVVQGLPSRNDPNDQPSNTTTTTKPVMTTTGPPTPVPAPTTTTTTTTTPSTTPWTLPKLLPNRG
jgi:hypothetical protein